MHDLVVHDMTRINTRNYLDAIPVLKILKENFLDLTSTPPGAALKPGRKIKLSAFWSCKVKL